MKILQSFTLLLVMLLGMALDASALKVTLEWDIPGSVKLVAEDSSKYDVELGADQTSYTWETEKSYGYVYAYAADGYRLTGAESSDGNKKYNISGTPPRITMGFNSNDNGLTVKIATAKLTRDDSFTVDVVNGLANILSAEFNSGYKLDLKKGEYSYKFNAEYDDPLSITLQAADKAYIMTLNGKELPKNAYYAQYDNIQVQNGDILKIQVFEKDDMEPNQCSFSVAYGPGMSGCIENIRDVGAGKWYYPSDFDSMPIDVLENATLRVNFNNEDFTIEKLSLNGADITDKMVTSSFNGSQYIEIQIKEIENNFLVEGKAKSYSTIDFTGYIINAEGLNFSLSYHGAPFQLAEGENVESDIELTSDLMMPADETKKYVIPISEKSPKFFFSPKEGYYIKNVYTKMPGGKIEQHSGNASITAGVDGTTFYMIAEKLADPYTATLNIIGEDLRFRISGGSALSSSWDNPSTASYSTTPGKREISFIPGFGTPIIFSFSSSENGTPALYLDGAEVTGIENSESGGLDFTVNPYYPTEESENLKVSSNIEVYNSFTQRPTMSGASLQLEGEGNAEFFYSPVLHEANPDGQIVISGTIFTVRPANPQMKVTYKGEKVKLNEDGVFTFEAKGNARNNVVKVGDIEDSSAVEVIETISGQENDVISLDGKVLRKNAPHGRHDGLGKGIYIINRRKVVIN